MFFVYILKSQKDNSLYIGYTHNLRKRLKEHNLGLVRSTKLKRPSYLVYYEAYASKQDAIKREITLNYERKL
jgi:putative endonuclease